ncbi:type I polyketide synthase [Streptomyces roseifaciens]|uniref:type I polyketide synthase n=1 Tax=Streptomyces roseifaciens TaxID=1488406 RepID=UPI0007180204|nr:type I polyketide synthase [Streptomyces roseifaciens]
MQQTEETATERAIAIVGVACRLPRGIDNLHQLWGALDDGRDLVSQVPPDRFDSERFVDIAGPRTGKSYTEAGGFLKEIAGFDAGYFGISPKEADYIDPQHRLLLELAAEALDDAAIRPAVLAGSDTAVYVGISDASYLALQDPRKVGAYTMSGAASSIAANRISHAFDLRGPSMVIDTACSSALVALDRACRTLWAGTSRAVLCGGANLLINPLHYIGFSQASMLSRRGRCAAFSADADGFVRAEGGGMVLLKPLPDALADGDRIHAVILGSATNCDGHTTGLALPNAQAQEELLRRAYAEAGVHPDELVYFEAHGTGTLAGDPAEATAIGRALGVRRITGELPIGSVKTNVGHLEPASGMAGLCKALLVLKHGAVPASLHGEPVNPDIDFASLGLVPVHRKRALPSCARPVVGVNSFGFGGANAHVILTSAPAPAESGQPTPPTSADRPLPVLISARSVQALREATANFAEHLAASPAGDFYDLAYTAWRRGRHEHRAVVLAQGAQEAARQLSALVSDAASEDGALQDQHAPATGASMQAVAHGRVAFVFSGNGSQWAGMGADLYAHVPVFRRAVDEVDAALVPRLGWSVARTLALPPAQWRLAATEVAQPLLFTVQVGIVAALRSLGVAPAVVLGHSVGEVAAAYTSGALTLDQAAQVIAERSAAQAPLTGNGRMAAVGMGPREAESILAACGAGLEIAGINSAQDVTVAGPADQVAALGRDLQQRGAFFRELDLDYAFHSAAMDPGEEPIRQALTDLAPVRASTPFYSTVTGTLLLGTELDASYWWQNIRRPVRFATAVELARADGADIFLEIGPHPVLRTYLRRAASADRQGLVAVLATLRRDGDGPGALRHTLAGLLAAGAPVETEHFFPRPGLITDLPAYPWQRRRHWVGTPQSWTKSSGSGLLDHPLLGERLPAPHPVWLGAIEPVLVPWLTDHRIQGSALMPATGYVEMALAAGRIALGAPVQVNHVRISSGLAVDWQDPTAFRLQLALRPEDGTVTIASTDEHGSASRTHATACVRSLTSPRPAPLDLEALKLRCPRSLTADDYYRERAAIGLEYGPAFRVLDELHIGDGEVLATYHHPAPADPYVIHPALLDGALQAGVQLLAERLDAGQLYLPASIGSVRLWGPAACTGTIRVLERSRTDSEVCWDLTLTDDQGTVTAQIDGCRLRRLASTRGTDITVHHTVLRAAPRLTQHCAVSPLPSPHALLTAAQPEIDRARSDQRNAHMPQAIAALKEFASFRHANALAALLPHPTSPFTIESLEANGLPPAHRRWATHLLPLLQRHNAAKLLDDGTWQLTADAFGVTDAARRCLTAEPTCSTALALAAQAPRYWARSLDQADGSAYAVEQLAEALPPHRLRHRIARALLTQMVAAWPVDRSLRVLEVGAGSGSLTAALLPVLPPERTRYCYTDFTASSLPAAQARFATYDFLDYRTLTPGADPAGQGFTPHSFDLIVAGDSLFASHDPEPTLRRLVTLLGPGGHFLGCTPHDTELLALLHAPSDLADLPARDQWPALLRRCGFTGIVQSGDAQDPCREWHSLFLARLPAHDIAMPVEPSTSPDSAFLVLTDGQHDEPLERALRTSLTERGCLRLRSGVISTSADEWERLLSQTAPQPLTVVLLLAAADDSDPAAQTAHTARQTAALSSLATAFRRLGGTCPVRLRLVTHPHCGVPTLERVTDTSPAASWGAARTLANEHPDLDARRIMLHRTGDPAADADRLVHELLEPDDEDEVVLTARDRFVPRERQAADALRLRPRSLPFGLRVHTPGLSYGLSWQQIETPQPGPGEVALEVRAVGLNFRDVMQCTGLLPTEMIEGTPSEKGPGIECAGIVTACGSGVTAFAPGDRVLGVASAALASHTVAKTHSLMPLPDHMSFCEAATVPVAFITAHYGLGHLARLRPGETVLVHGAAGAVGLAVLHYAEQRGARVIATAGNGVKRAFLRAIGIGHVLDSRTLDFAEQVREISDGQGVDVVVNSLAGEAIARSLELLRPGGRFIELGKRDIYENKPLSLHPFNNNIAFFGMDISPLLNDPGFCKQLSAEVIQQMQGDYRGLPHTVFPAARVHEALQLLQHSRHIGKVVVTFDALDESPLVEPAPVGLRLDTTGTYLITGGTGGFGATTASWLAHCGARHLALVSRRGMDAPEAAPLLAALAERGVHATAHAVDVTDAQSMHALVAEIDRSGFPLRGVVHAAMDLDDAPLVELDQERIAAVLAPKMTGASVLDVLTRGRECDLFLLYSSGSAMLGNIKQAPYCGGNLYLEALARIRRQDGFPGLALAWGAVAGTGYVARTGMTEALAGLGIDLLAPCDAFATAERLLTRDYAVAGAGRYRWSRTAVLPQTARPRLRGLIPAPTREGTPSREEVLQSLRGMPVEAAFAHLVEELTRMIAETLHMNPDDLEAHQRLDALGMDSLMSTQLLAALHHHYDVEIPPMEVLGSGGTISGFAQIIQVRLGLGSRADAGAGVRSKNHQNPSYP